MRVERERQARNFFVRYRQHRNSTVVLNWQAAGKRLTFAPGPGFGSANETLANGLGPSNVLGQLNSLFQIGQKQVYRAAHKPLGIAAAIPTFPQLRLASAMEKWKSKGRIPTFPRRFIPLSKSKRKESQSRLLPLSFRLISGLENTVLRHMRCRIHAPQLGHEIPGVVSLVASHSYVFAVSGPVHHQQGRIALRCTAADH
jgi:hypothetical protein